MRQQKTASSKERIQALYLLKTGQVETKAPSSGVGERTDYSAEVVKSLPFERIKQSGGVRKKSRTTKSDTTRAGPQLKQEFPDFEGCKSYEETRTWLRAASGIKASYKVALS